jgi:hypothetical protein
MIDESKCNHPTGYERTLETERFYITILRCSRCGKFLKCVTKEKLSETKLDKRA